MAFKGAYPGAEMQRGLAYPAYYQPTEDDFELQLLEINYPQKFAELHHRQVMGAVLSTGVERGPLVTLSQVMSIGRLSYKDN